MGVDREHAAGRLVLDAAHAALTALPIGLHRPDEPLLHHRHRERAVAPVDEPFGQPAPGLRRRTALVVQQPLVGAQRPVEPHRMVEARDHEAVVVPRARVRHHRGVEQREVGRVRNDAVVQQRIVGELAVGAEPHELLGLPASPGSGSSQRGRSAERVSIGRSRMIQSANSGGNRSVCGSSRSAHRRQRLRIGRLGHRVLVLRARLEHVERRRQVEDRLAVLDRDHPPRREAAAVADAVDVVDDRHPRVAGPQEVGVQRVHVAVFHGAARRDRAPAPRPAPEHALPVLVGAEPAEQVHFELLQLQQLDQLVQRGPISRRS